MFLPNLDYYSTLFLIFDANLMLVLTEVCKYFDWVNWECCNYEICLVMQTPNFDGTLKKLLCEYRRFFTKIYGVSSF